MLEEPKFKAGDLILSENGFLKKIEGYLTDGRYRLSSPSRPDINEHVEYTTNIDSLYRKIGRAE